jgi:Na+/phosphate symporter
MEIDRYDARILAQLQRDGRLPVVELAESIETSAIHLDVLTSLKRINSHVTGIAYPIVEAK